MKSELQKEYEDLLNSLEFSDPSSYAYISSLSSKRYPQNILRSIKEIVDALFKGINGYNRLYVQMNRRLEKKDGDLTYTYDFDEEFSEDTIENRIKLLKIISKPISGTDLTSFSEIGHCTKKGIIKSSLVLRGKKIDRIVFDNEVRYSIENNEFLKTHNLSKEQLDKIIEKKREASKNLQFFRRKND